MPLPNTAISLDNSQISLDSSLPSTAIPLNSQNSANPTDLSSVSDLNTEDSSTNPPIQDKLNIGDHSALSFLNNPDDQKNYLQKKFPYVIPDNKGNFMVGENMSELSPVSPSGSGTTFMKWLASQSSQLAPIVGMTVGSLAGVPGAAAGAAAGTAIDKAIGSAIGANESPLKMGVDTAISGAFGAIGQKAAQMFGLAAGKIIAPKLAQMVDGRLTQMVNNGEDSSKFINFVSKAVHFASGADSNDVATLMKYGVNKSLSDPSVSNKNAIINIAQKLVEDTKNTDFKLSGAVGKSIDNLKNKAGADAPVNTEETLLGIAKGFNDSKLGVLYEPTDDGTLFKIRQDIGNSLHVKPLNDFMTRLGAVKSSSDPMTYLIPKGVQTSLDEAIGAKQIFGDAFNNKNIDGNVGRIMKTAMYGEGPSLKYPQGFMGLRGELNKIAEHVGAKDFITSNQDFSKWQNTLSALNNAGIDPMNPQSIGNYALKVNDRLPIDSKALQLFSDTIGTDSFDKLKQYGAIQKLSNFNPNFLRLGMISGALGSLLGSDGPVSEGGFKRALIFGSIGTPMGLKTTLKAVESGGNVGSSVLSKLISNNVYNRSGTAVATQAGKKILYNLVNNNNNP